MTTTLVASETPKVLPSGRSGVPGWLYFVFFLSGISGLMYQVVWVRMLGRVLGNTVYATSTVLAAFMAGLALGSYLISWRADRVGRPILWYAVLEIGIGLSALFTLVFPNLLVPLYRAIYQAAGEARAVLTAGQVVIALAVLLLPTVQMGATLPILSAFGARRHPSFGRCVGTLYALNTLGAVVGVLASGFVLIGLVGETRTLLIGGAINALVAVAALILGRHEHLAADATTPQPVGPPSSGPADAISQYPTRARQAVAVCFALNGLVALGFEVVWARLLPIYVGNSIYGFSAMLAVVLAGLVLGSWWGTRLVDRGADPLRLLANVQLLVGLAAVVGLWMFPLPLYGYNRFWHGVLPSFLAIPAMLIGPFALLSGMAFPLAVHCYVAARSQGGRSIGRLYAWNTLGCIAGALLVGFVFIPLLHTWLTGLILASVSLVLGLALLCAHPRGIRQTARAPQLAAVLGFAVLASLCGDVLYRALQRKVSDVVGSGLITHHHFEEAAATVTSLGKRDPSSRFSFLLINGQNMTVLTPVTKLMAHLPLALADAPKDALVICFGMGTTFLSASAHEDVKVTAVELVGGTLKCFDDFHPGGSRLFKQPNRRAVVDDGRSFLLMSQQEYDTITVDPAPPIHSAGTVNLYSREFFQLCKSRLRPGGVMCLWVPPGPQTEVKMILRTFLDAFEHVNIWSGSEFAGFFLIGTRQPLEDVRGKIARLYNAPAVVADLNAWGKHYDCVDKVLALHVGDEKLLRPFVEKMPVITDDLPYTEFILWRYFYNPEFRTEFDARQLKQAIR